MYNSFIYEKSFDKQLNSFRSENEKFDVIDLIVNGVEWVLAKDETLGTLVGIKESLKYFTYPTLGFEEYDGFLVTYTINDGTISFCDLRARLTPPLEEDSSF
jgi:hypothetical protein